MTPKIPSYRKKNWMARSSGIACSQHGATLIELMVGITVGLLTIAVAMGALMVSRGVSGTISDASQLQQQAAYAFRVFGQQFRQAGSIRLNLAANKNPGDTIDPADVVAFSPNPNITPVSGKSAPASGEYTISVAYQNYSEASFTSASEISLFRDCLGEKKDPDIAVPATLMIPSQFVLNNTTSELVCAGANNIPQAIIKNVADFQVRYLVQTEARVGTPKIRALDAAGVGADWSGVFGVDVCLVLYGDESIDMPSGSSYKGCDNADIDITTLAGPRKNRLHMLFRNVYQLRSQGLAG